MSKAISFYGLRQPGKNRALRLLSEARSWAAVNDIVENGILTLFEYLDRNDIEAIFKYPSETGADLRHSGGLFKIVERVRGSKMYGADELDQILKRNNLDYLVAS